MTITITWALVLKVAGYVLAVAIGALAGMMWLTRGGGPFGKM